MKQKFRHSNKVNTFFSVFTLEINAWVLMKRDNVHAALMGKD